jgi:hypothetical protein
VFRLLVSVVRSEERCEGGWGRRQEERGEKREGGDGSTKSVDDEVSRALVRSRSRRSPMEAVGVRGVDGGLSSCAAASPPPSPWISVMLKPVEFIAVVSRPLWAR